MGRETRPLQTFSVITVGDGFPVPKIRLAKFQFFDWLNQANIHMAFSRNMSPCFAGLAKQGVLFHYHIFFKNTSTSLAWARTIRWSVAWMTVFGEGMMVFVPSSEKMPMM